MVVNRDNALDAFNAYAGEYDSRNPRIALKIDHTLRVAALCDRIARSLALSEDDVDLAWLLGLLHDIGRFEQLRRFDSFSDSLVDHATLGAHVLFDQEGPSTALVRRFTPDSSEDALIRTAVQTHSAYRLPADQTPRTRMFCNILRDADKIDILEVNCTSPIEDIYNVPESAMVQSELSPECVEIFYEHRCIPRGIRRHPADIMLSHICFAWELVFEESLTIAREQGHLQTMLHRTWKNPETQSAFKEIATHMQSTLGIPST